MEMKTTCYQLSEGTFISAVNWPGWDAIEQDKDLQHPYWLVVEDIATAELAENLRHLNLHPLIMEDCLTPDHSTLVNHFTDAVYIEFPTNAGDEYGEVAYLSMICINNAMVTISQGDVAELPNFITYLQQDGKLTMGNTANLLYLLIDYFIDKTISQSLVYRQQLNHLVKKLIADPEDADPSRIMDLKRKITHLYSMCEDQLFCAKAISKLDHPVINATGQESFFNGLVSNGEYALRSITRLNGRIKDLQDAFTLQNHDSQEKRLRFLTLISVIFLPLTFITGFFGMNFVDMRLLRVAYGSMIAVTIMVTVFIGLLWYFKSRGWFD
jgi:magnesium transporter